MPFEDNFSRQSPGYARHRPMYPEALFEYIASIAPGCDVAWDCGTGNGQAAVGLAGYFGQVIATDASASQIGHAMQHERVDYRVAPAEHTDIESASVDAVTVAQAIHWFDLDTFYAEVRRVLKPGGVLVVWSYSHSEIDPAVDRLLVRLYRDIVGEYWSPKLRLVEGRYAALPFPFRELAAPGFSIEVRWTLDDLTGYLGSWSALQKFIEVRGYDPIDDIRGELADAWGGPSHERVVRWQVHMKAGVA